MRRSICRLGLSIVLLFAPGVIHSSHALELRAPLSYRTWNVDEADVALTTSSQWVAPLQLSIPLGRQIDLVAQGGIQSGMIDDGESHDLTGATDTQIGLVVRLADDRLLLQGSVSVPTGQTLLDTLERRIAIALSPPFLGYRVRQPGRGRDLGVGASYAFPIASKWALGIGAGYLLRGSFTPIEGGLEVEPGPESRFSLGIDGRLGPAQIQLDGTRRIYGADKGSGIDYEEPPVWEGSFGLSAQADGWSFGTTALLSKKEEGDVGISAFSGTYFGGVLTLSRAIGATSWIGLTGETVRFKGDDDELGNAFQSQTGGVGPLLLVPLGGSFRIESRFLYLFGDLDGESINGFDAQLLLSLSTVSKNP